MSAKPLENQITFYRNKGIRTFTNLTNPNLSNYFEIRLPTNSIYHYYTNDITDNGPSTSEPIFKNAYMPPSIGHITILTNQQGNPVHTSSQAPTLIRDYHMDHRAFKMLKNIDAATRQPNALAVYNYNLLHQMYKYVRSVYSTYYRWFNIFSTMIQNIADTLKITGTHHHYFTINVPQVMPSLQQFDKLDKKIDQATLVPFTDPSTLAVFELWRFVGPNPNTSVLNLIPKDHLHKVNIILRDLNNYLVINLGNLISFKIQDTDPLLAIKQANNLKADQLQKRIIFLNMKIVAIRNDVKDEQVAEANPEQIDHGSDVSDLSDQTQMNNQGDDLTIKEDTVVDSQTDNVDGMSVDVVQNDEEGVESAIQKEDELIDQHLNKLVELEAKQKENQDITQTRSLGALIRQPALDIEEAFMRKCDAYAMTGVMSTGQYRRFEKIAEASKTMPAPDGTPMKDFINIDPKDLIVDNTPNMKDHDVILDKSMLTNNLMKMEEQYISQVLQKDIASCVMNVMNAGVAVTSYKSEDVTDIGGSYQHLTVKLQPLEGVQSTIRMKLPKVDTNGLFKVNGVKYRVRKQRGEIPICKTGPDKVTITSYYGKCFVNRGRKKSNDYGYWLRTEVMALAMQENSTIEELITADVFDGEQNAPRAFTSLSMGIKSFKYKGYKILLDVVEKEKVYPEAMLKSIEKDGTVLFGYGGPSARPYLTMDKNNVLYSTNGEDTTIIGPFESWIGLTSSDSPIEFAEVSVYGKEIPVGVILGYRIGLTKLISLLKTPVRRVPPGQRLNLLDSEYSIAFSDETIIFSKDDIYASIILAGFNEWARSIRNFSSRSFDNAGVYLNLLESVGLSGRYLREIDLMYDLFIDPITLGLLKEYKEPETFEGLLLRACDLLTDDYCLPAGDARNLRDKGYERMAGAIYTELTQAIRQHSSKLAKSTHPVEMSPYTVWNRIVQDPAKSQVSELNPIMSLKEIEAVTYSGTDGRNRRSMTKKTRAYNKYEMGVTSESTVDSSDVGINFQVTANPQYKSLRGTINPLNYKESGPASLLSTSAMLSPGSDQDDPKRVNFIAIQQAHSIACDSYRQFPLRTGYEAVVGQRTTDMYCYTAKKKGRVMQINDQGIIVEYDDGDIQGYELGTRHGNAAGLVVPHTIVSPLKVGDKVDIGDCICYNTGFFEPDFFDKKRVVWKNACMVRMVLWESTETLEDSSYISEKLTNKLSTKHTKVKNISVNFKQKITNIVKTGQEVDAKTILCYIEDEVTAAANIFTDDTISTLELLSKKSPKAGVKGIIDKIEVLYHGDKEDMSDSIRAIADESDARLRKIAKSTNQEAFTGSVDSSYRIDNNSILLDTCVIRVYITQNVAQGVGDKGVFFNQMKTVHSGIMPGVYMTESGEEIDVIFGQKSIDDRIVHSPALIGTTNTLLRLAAKRMCEAYKK